MEQPDTDCVHHYIIADARVRGREVGTCKKCGVVKRFHPPFYGPEAFGKSYKEHEAPPWIKEQLEYEPRTNA